MANRRSTTVVLFAWLVLLAGCGQVSKPIEEHDGFAPTGVATQALSWSIETLDGTDAPYAAVAMASGSDGIRHIAFVESVEDVLKYVSGHSGNWSDVETVGSAQDSYPSSASLSLAVDPDGVPRVAYFAEYGAPAYATRADGAWPITAEVVSPYASLISFAVDGNGVAHIVYLGSSGLQHVVQTSEGWSASTVFAGPAVGAISSGALALDSEGHPHVAVMWTEVTWPVFHLKLGYTEATFGDDGQITWPPLTVVDGDDDVTSAGFVSLALDGTDHPHIAYRSGSGDLKYLGYDGSGWGTPEVVDTGDSFAPSIALDSGGTPHVAYLVRPAGMAIEAVHYGVRGDTGWQTEGVDDAGDAESPALLVDAVGRPHISYAMEIGINRVLRYATVTSAPGDTTPPVITPNVLGTLGDNGWYVGDVGVTWSVVDDESDISSTSGCDAMSITNDTTGTTLTCTATSAGGTESQSVTIERDATAPVVRVNGVTDGATYAVGSVPAASCSTSDPTSGVADAATLSLTGGPTGAVTASCLGAKDVAGNTGSATVTYTVLEAVDPVAATESLIDDVDQLLTDGVLKAGQAKGLIKPLENALRSLSKDKPLDAWNQLGDFILKVTEKVPPLTEAQANELIASAEAIRAVLDGD